MKAAQIIGLITGIVLTGLGLVLLNARGTVVCMDFLSTLWTVLRVCLAAPVGAGLGWVIGKRIGRAIANLRDTGELQSARFAAFLALTFPIGAGCMLVGGIRQLMAPSQAQLIQDFRRLEPDLVLLQRLLEKQKDISYVDQNLCRTFLDRPSEKMRSSNLQLCRAAMARIGACSLHLGQPDDLDVDIWVQEGEDCGSNRVGYAYCEDPPANQVSSIDNVSSSSTYGVVFCHLIQPHWYVFTTLHSK